MDPQNVEIQDLYKNLRELAASTRIFCFEEIERATNNFNEGDKIGSGSYGTVYKGILTDGTQVAVKRVNNVERAVSQFIAEIMILANVENFYLVGLRGYCIHMTIDMVKVFCIVYDLLPNRSLDEWIFRRNGMGKCLSWEVRYKIAVEVAKALVYLHHECSPTILHLDIKPGNILLRDNFQAVLSDFGMSRRMKNDHDEDKEVRGTPGYIAPEWKDGHRVSVRFDIFSYGMVLMDLFFGECFVCLDKKGKDIYVKGGNSEEQLQTFHDFMLKEVRRGAIRNHIDKRILDKNEIVDEKEVICLIRAALRCVHENPDKRPISMKEVVSILERRIVDGTIEQARFPWVPEHFKVLTSREPTKNEIIQELKDNDRILIGIYGVEGVGKTTLMKQVCEEVESTNLFTKVVFVTVSQNLDKKLIQIEIAENLGLKIDEESLRVRAQRIFTRLRQEKNVLIILDDLRAGLGLRQLGINPCNDSLHSCKVVVVSESLDVCESMETTKNIEVQMLSDKDSLDLFISNVGSVNFRPPHQESVDIAKECEGLPSAIFAFAWALRNKDKAEWPEIIKQKRKTLFLGMFYDLQSKFENQLVVLEAEIQGKIVLARNNGLLIDKVAEDWLLNVDDVRCEMERLFHEAEDLKGRYACHELCEESKRVLVDVNKLLDEGGRFSTVADPAKIPKGVKENVCDLESRIRTQNLVIQALKDCELVGVYGMGGVGKTTLVNQVSKEVEETNLFNKVVVATVCAYPDVREIQKLLAEGLGVDLKEESTSARASRLAEVLRHRNNILIILDDLWKRFNLAEIGICLGKDCKVLIVSRSLDVCTCMKTAKNIKLEVLSAHDSLELFQHVLGNIDSESKREMSEKIVDECGGLPLAIVRLAENLEGKDDVVWKAVITALKHSVCEKLETVNNSIKRSYDFLHRKNRLCFLLCSLFPENHKIRMERLIGYATGEGLLEDVDTPEDAHQMLYLMVDKLVSSGMLLKVENRELVMMHSIFRDTAISIAREGNMSIIKAGLGLNKWPNDVVTRSSLRMSLMSNDIHEVPRTPGCSQLVTLSLASNKLLRRIPDHFFDDMQHLATLDLSNTSISRFPRSLSSLQSLRSLYCDDCKVRDIAVIGRLKALEVLSLRGTRISKLPREVRDLYHLKIVYI